MKRFLFLFVITAFLAGCAGASLSTLNPLARSTAVEVTPFAADSLVDSVGIVTHLGYRNTPYTRNWRNNRPAQSVQRLIAELGVRHIRDNIPHPTLQPNRAYIRRRLARLYKRNGIRFITPVDTRDDSGTLVPDRIAPILDEYANGVIELQDAEVPTHKLLEAIEGPNEYDKHNNQQKREAAWVENLRNYQSLLYKTVKESPNLSNLPVAMPSLIFTKYCSTEAGMSFEDISDYGNLHPYPTYPYFQIPVSKFDWHLNHGKKCFGDKPVYLTEIGYRTGELGIDDITIAKYMSTLIPEAFLKQQFERTYLYSLMDIRPKPRHRWGLVNSELDGQGPDGEEQFKLTRRPGYYAVQSLLNLLGEASWDSEEEAWTVPEAELTPVEIQFEDEQSSTHHLLLQKSTGDYYLLLWQQIESFNPDEGNFQPPPDDVEILLPRGYEFQTLYRYGETFEFESLPLTDVGNSYTAQVPDSVTVLSFKKN